MRKIVLLAIILLGFITGCKEDKKPVATLVEAPPLYEDLDGNAVDLDNFRGKRLVLNYWATWCKPCIEEMPAMARTEAALADANYVFLFASDESIDKISAFKAQRNFGLDYIKFNGSYADLEISALPVTLIFSSAGEQVERIDGAVDWDSEAMIENLKLVR